jgi:hypothetical protein
MTKALFGTDKSKWLLKAKESQDQVLDPGKFNKLTRGPQNLWTYIHSFIQPACACFQFALKPKSLFIITVKFDVSNGWTRE